MNAKQIEDAFNEWWETSGKYYDPDTDDVPWYDKRRELAAVAFFAGHNSTEEVIDTRTHTTSDEELKALCEVKAPTICKNCEFFMRYATAFIAGGAVDFEHRCKAVRIKYVSDAPNNFELCTNVNGGACQHYRAAPVVEKESDKKRPSVFVTVLHKISAFRS